MHARAPPWTSLPALALPPLSSAIAGCPLARLCCLRRAAGPALDGRAREVMGAVQPRDARLPPPACMGSVLGRATPEGASVPK